MNDDPYSKMPRLGGAATHTSSKPEQPKGGHKGGFFDWLRSLGRSRAEEGSLRSTLEELIEEHEDSEQPLNPEERLMLRNIIGFGEIRVDDVMVPRADIVGVEVSTPLDAVVETFRKNNHSRMPVYRDTLDNPVGMIHIKDLIGYWRGNGAFNLKKAARELLFVPPSMPVADLLLKMRATRIHMALVVDEYGGTDGLLTIEDLVEEIVGEIQDEHDVETGPLMVEVSEGIFEADARVEVEELEQRLELDLLDEEEEEEIDTLGGLVIQIVGRVPQRGEVVAHPAGLTFEVLDADPRRVKRLRIRAAALTEEKAD